MEGVVGGAAGHAGIYGVEGGELMPCPLSLAGGEEALEGGWGEVEEADGVASAEAAGCGAGNGGVKLPPEFRP